MTHYQQSLPLTTMASSQARLTRSSAGHGASRREMGKSTVAHRLAVVVGVMIQVALVVLALELTLGIGYDGGPGPIPRPQPVPAGA